MSVQLIIDPFRWVPLNSTIDGHLNSTSQLNNATTSHPNSTAFAAAYASPRGGGHGGGGHGGGGHGGGHGHSSGHHSGFHHQSGGGSHVLPGKYFICRFDRASKTFNLFLIQIGLGI